jgi:hypothetical protein
MGKNNIGQQGIEIYHDKKDVPIKVFQTDKDEKIIKILANEFTTVLVKNKKTKTKKKIKN